MLDKTALSVRVGRKSGGIGRHNVCALRRWRLVGFAPAVPCYGYVKPHSSFVAGDDVPNIKGTL